MIESAWNEYRGWARRSRTLQQSIRNWNTAAAACAALAAVLGAATTGRSYATAASLAALAAVASAVTPILGRHILETGSEARWIRARAAAEDIKSECFAFAAGIPPYDRADRNVVFIQRRNALAEGAFRAGLTPLPDLVDEQGDNRQPPVPMDADWYLAHRVRDQTSVLCRPPGRARACRRAPALCRARVVHPRRGARRAGRCAPVVWPGALDRRYDDAGRHGGGAWIHGATAIPRRLIWGYGERSRADRGTS